MPLLAFVRSPAVVPRPEIVSAFEIVMAPHGQGSSTLIAPFAAVFDCAPASVLHGAVRLHGLASSPTPETQVRVAWAEAALGSAAARRARAMTDSASRGAMRRQ